LVLAAQVECLEGVVAALDLPLHLRHQALHLLFLPALKVVALLVEMEEQAFRPQDLVVLQIQTQGAQLTLQEQAGLDQDLQMLQLEEEREADAVRRMLLSTVEMEQQIHLLIHFQAGQVAVRQRVGQTQFQRQHAVH
jgi:hypothetical protein